MRVNSFTAAINNRQSSTVAEPIQKSVTKTSRPEKFQPQADSVFISQRGDDFSEKQENISAAKPVKAADKPDDAQLNSQELKQLNDLQRRDREVRTHEQAHLSAAGQYARSGASFTYQLGPDGNSYAVGGEVNIDVGKERTPEATIAKMQRIKRAALAPANPSQADRSIASQATAEESQARRELLLKSQEELLQVKSEPLPLDPSQSASSTPNSKDSASVSSTGISKTAMNSYKNAASM